MPLYMAVLAARATIVKIGTTMNQHLLLYDSVLPRKNSRHDRRAWFGQCLWPHQSLDTRDPHSHIKEKNALKACWANVPYICWGEHCTTFNYKWEGSMWPRFLSSLDIF